MTVAVVGSRSTPCVVTRGGSAQTRSMPVKKPWRITPVANWPMPVALSASTELTTKPASHRR